MKKIASLFIAFSVVLTGTIAENRRNLLKEINHHKNITYKNARYKVEAGDLKRMLYDYLSDNEYTFLTDSDSTITFYKKINLACKQSERLKKLNGYPHVQCKTRYYLTIYIEENTDGTKQVELSDFIDSFNWNTRRSNFFVNTLGTYSANHHSLYKRLYNCYDGKMIAFPENLLLRIEAFNRSQDNYKKQLIAGRDY